MARLPNEMEQIRHARIEHDLKMISDRAHEIKMRATRALDTSNYDIIDNWREATRELDNIECQVKAIERILERLEGWGFGTIKIKNFEELP